MFVHRLIEIKTIWKISDHRNIGKVGSMQSIQVRSSSRLFEHKLTNFNKGNRYSFPCPLSKGEEL